MPLLRGHKFVKQKPPTGLDLNDEVFFCPITLEIFTTYEELFSRTLLVNGRSWSCSMCLKSNLTYLEAIDCEITDFKQVSLFGNALLRAILKIVSSVRVTEINPLLDLINKFGYSRYFIGEIIEYKTDDMSVYKPGQVEFITINKEVSAPSQSPFPASNSLLYYIVEYEKGKPKNDERLILSYEFVKRKYPNLLNLEKLRFLIRRTCEFQSDILMPKLEFLQRCQLYPHGSITWSDIFPGIEPNWSSFLPSSCFKRSSLQKIQLGQNDKNYQNLFPGKLEQDQNKMLSHNANNLSSTSSVKGQLKFLKESTKSKDSNPKADHCSGGLSISSTNNSLQFNHDSRSYDANSKNTRVEYNELTNEWCSLITRDDLECPDLVPLPEFSKIDIPFTNIEFSMVIQIIEFYHKFSAHLSLMVPSLGLEKSTEPFSVTQSFWNTQNTVMSYTLNSSGTLLINDFELILRNSDPTGPFADLIIGLMLTIRKLENELNSKPPTSSALATAGAASSVVGNSSLPIINNGIKASVASKLMTALSSATNLGIGATIDSISPYLEMIQSYPDMAEKLLLLYRKSAVGSMISELVGISTQVASGKAGKAAISFASTIKLDDSNLSNSSFNCSSTLLNNSTSDTPSSLTALAKACAIAASTGAMSQIGLDRSSLSYALWLHFITSPARGGGFRGQIWGGTRPFDDPAFMFLRNHHDIVDKLRIANIFSLSITEKLMIMTTLIEEILIQPQIREIIEISSEKSRHLRYQHRNILLPVQSPVPEPGQPSTTSGVVATTNANEAENTNKARGTMSTNGSVKSQNVKKILIPDNGNHSNSNESAYKLNPTSIANQSHEEIDIPKDALFWETIFEYSRNGSMTPLGQDRMHRTYWLIPSIPAVLIEPAPIEIITGQLGSIYDHNGRKRKQRPMKVLVKQLPEELLLGMDCQQVFENCEKLYSEIESNGNFNSNTNYIVKTGNIGRREVILNQLAIDFLIKYNKDKVDIDILRSLSNPEVPSNTNVHLSHPAVKQVYDYVNSKENQRWSLLYPERGAISETDEEIDRKVKIDKILKQLEYCLNPRGIREHKLRQSINNYRSIIMRSIQSCPIEYFIKPNNVNQPPSSEEITDALPSSTTPKVAQIEQTLETVVKNDESRPCERLKTSEDIQIAWLDRNLSQMKRRLTRKKQYKVDFNRDLEGIFTPEDILQIKEFLSASFDNDKIKKYSQFLLKICFDTNPFCLSGSISSEDRTLRGGLAFLFFVKNSQNLDKLFTENKNFKLNENDESLLSKHCHHQTNGFQRWISCVMNAHSVSQLHLLARTLERAVRKTETTVKGLKSAVNQYAESNPLPELLCSSCHGKYIENSTIKATNGIETALNSLPYQSFVRCSTCASPFHYHCLIDSNSRNIINRTVMSRKKTSNSWHSMNSQVNPKAALLLGQFTANTTSTNQKASDNSEISQAALILCQACKSLANLEMDKWKLSCDEVPLRYKSNHQESPNPSSPTPTSEQKLSTPIFRELGTSESTRPLTSKKRSISRVSVELKPPIDSKRPATIPSNTNKQIKLAPTTMSQKQYNNIDPSSSSTLDVKENKLRVFDKSSAMEFLKEIMALPSAKPLNKCGISKTLNCHDDVDKKEKLYAQDLIGLFECLSRDGFPDGPLQVISQLKILIQRWLTLNRDGSRLHQCAKDLQVYIDTKLRLENSRVEKVNNKNNNPSPVIRHEQRTRRVPKKMLA